MNNLISVFMNYKLNRLIEYGVVVYQNESPFIRRVFGSYFQTYIDNYYYGIFNTVDDDKYTEENLNSEFIGIMEEMLYDYKDYENKVSEEEYQNNVRIIKELKDIALLILPLDTLEIKDEESIPSVVDECVNKNITLKAYLDNRKEKLIKLIKDTYLMNKKIIDYENVDFTFREKKFLEVRDCIWVDLVPSIPSLEGYRKGLIDKVNQDETLAFSKLECLVQMLSHMILKNFLDKKETIKYFISLDESFVSRVGIDEKVQALVDNPMFQKYVYLAIPYNVFTKYKNAFSEDYHFAFTQDFSHINDIFQKVDAIYNEGFTNYMIVSDCRDDDRDYFINYKNEVMSVLMFEEE